MEVRRMRSESEMNIIRMAREAGFAHSWSEAAGEALERFAALAIAAEREACAKVCEEDDDDEFYFGRYYAAAIRARGEE